MSCGLPGVLKYKHMNEGGNEWMNEFSEMLIRYIARLYLYLRNNHAIITNTPFFVCVVLHMYCIVLYKVHYKVFYSK